MEFDKHTILSILGASGVAAFWKPILRLITGQAKQREKDIGRLEARLERETEEVKEILQAQIIELRERVTILMAQNLAQQNMINDLNLEVRLLRAKAEVKGTPN